MRVTNLVSSLAIASSALSIFNGLFSNEGGQIVLSNEEDARVDKNKASAGDIKLEELFENIGFETPALLTRAWAEMQAELSPEKIASMMKDFNKRKHSKQPIRKVGQETQEEKAIAKEKEESMKPEKHFSQQSQNDFEVLSNKKFEDYSMRVKSNNPEVLGLDSVKQYTGYIDVQSIDHHYFFWFFESRNDPENDPVVLWLNGGPGCSSATGLFFELGPASINSTLEPVHNPYSWNSNASVIFLDQPVGVGYSYAGGEDEVKNTDTAAKNVFVFLELFFQKFPQFSKNKFHIAGESYAGHYIPKFASEILSNADRSFELSSVLIGNGITDALIQAGSYKPMACGEGGYKPVLEESQCEQMERDYPKCASLAKLCYEFQTAFTCVPAEFYCENKLFQPYAETGLNPYDIRKSCAEEGGNCYVEMNYIDDYLNLEYVKRAVGASNIDIFTSCDDTVFRNFLFDGDEYKPFQQYVAELLEKNIPVLIYAGDKDYICNWLGNYMWVNKLDYEDGEIFASLPLQPWIPQKVRKSEAEAEAEAEADQKGSIYSSTESSVPAGQVKNYKHFTYLRIYDAGHMVPYDQPKNSLAMLNAWIQGDYALGYSANCESPPGSVSH